VSDKYLTEHCGILQKLLSGDVVLADRGFDIAESVGSMRQSRIFLLLQKERPNFLLLKWKKPANVRIHVEHVIGAVRQFYRVLCQYIMQREEMVKPFH